MRKSRALSLLALVLFMGLVSFVNSAWAGKNPGGDQAAQEQAARNIIFAQRNQSQPAPVPPPPDKKNPPNPNSF